MSDIASLLDYYRASPLKVLRVVAITTVVSSWIVGIGTALLLSLPYHEGQLAAHIGDVAGTVLIGFLVSSLFTMLVLPLTATFGTSSALLAIWIAARSRRPRLALGLAIAISSLVGAACATVVAMTVRFYLDYDLQGLGVRGLGHAAAHVGIIAWASGIVSAICTIWWIEPSIRRLSEPPV